MGEVYCLAADSEFVVVEVVGDGAVGNNVGSFGGAAPRHCVDAGDELGEGEGLFHVVVGTGVEEGDFLVGCGLDREGDNGRVDTFVTNHGAQRNAGNVGKHVVENNTIKNLTLDKFEAVFGIVCLGDIKSF